LGCRSLKFATEKETAAVSIVARAAVSVERPIVSDSGVSLENIANRVAKPVPKAVPTRGNVRALRFAARGVLWDLSGEKRCRSCGRWSITPDGSVQARKTSQAVGYAGLATCGRVWVCPVCNAKIQAARRLEVGAALSFILGTDGGAAFGSYTLRHHARTDPDRLWRGLSKCWQAVKRDGSVRRLRVSMGYLGTIRAAECTYGANGWHPHIHVVHLFSRPVSVAEVAALHAAEFRAWAAGAARLGLSAPSDAAQDLHVVTGATADVELGDYFTKASYTPTVEAVGWEMTSSQTKTRTRAKDSRTPWDLLAAVHLEGDADALDLWHIWERFSKGKRALTWTRGLRALCGLGVEREDEEVAEEAVGTADDVLFTIADWAPFRAHPVWGAELLTVVEVGGKAAGLAWCAERGIEIRGA